MIWILLSLFALVYITATFTKKYRNPYKLRYIFGLKGAGKSTFMVKLMLRDLKHGWTVYTNMSDLAVDGVRFFNTDELKVRTPEPHSSLYIDEAGLLWDNRGFKSFDTGFTEFFKLQRKYKCKVTINSQSFDVDKKIRDLVDDMYLMTNIFGCIGVARPIRRTIKLLEAQGQSEARIADNLRFEHLWNFKFFWMPSYWKYFDSFKAPERDAILFKVLTGAPVPAKLQLREILQKWHRKSPPSN